MQNLDSTNYSAITKGSVCLIFSAPWCGPCKALASKLEKSASSTKVQLFKVDIEEFPELASRHRVRSVPQAVCMYNNEVVDVLVGADKIHMDNIEAALR